MSQHTRTDRPHRIRPTEPPVPDPERLVVPVMWAGAAVAASSAVIAWLCGVATTERALRVLEPLATGIGCGIAFRILRDRLKWPEWVGLLMCVAAVAAWVAWGS